MTLQVLVPKRRRWYTPDPMLLPCPECEREVSDKAEACPGCGFPIANHVDKAAADKRADDALASRKQIGEVDCVSCEARGYRRFPFTTADGNEEFGFEWCAICECSGRIILCESADGYYAVGFAQIESFLGGSLDADDKTVFHLGDEKPTEHRFPKAGERRR